MSIETLREKLEVFKEFHEQGTFNYTDVPLLLSDFEVILAHIQPSPAATITQAHWATLRELADDLSNIVQAVSSRDGDATARQHQRAEAVRAAVKALDPARQAAQPSPDPTQAEDPHVDRLVALIEKSLAYGGCSNCGGLPHTTTCRVGRLAAAFANARPQPSPDLRGLVEQWRKNQKLHNDIAHFDSDPYGDYGHEQRIKAAMLKKCADELEAAIATTPEPK